MNNYGFDYINYVTGIPNNMIYDNNQIDNNYPINYPKDNQEQLFNPIQGLTRGNLFVNLYNAYKNYQPMPLMPMNERDTLLYQIMQYKFALVDLNLYLDTHPNDSKMISLYNKYLTIEKQMCDKYESMYGPLTLDSNYLENNTWNWKNSPWPWEVM